LYWFNKDFGIPQPYYWSAGRWEYYEGETSWTEVDVGSAVYTDHVEGEKYLGITYEKRKNLTGNYWSAGYWIMTSSGDWETNTPASYAWMEMEVGSTNYADHHEGDPYAGDLIICGDAWGEEFSYYAHNAFWRWCKASNTDYYTQDGLFWRWTEATYGNKYFLTSAILDYVTLWKEETSGFNCVFRIDNLPHGQYDIKVVRCIGDRNDLKYTDSFYLAEVREIVYDEFTYPRMALVGLKALATDQLSGSLDFSTLVEGRKVRVYRADEVKGTDGKNYRCTSSHTSSSSTRPIDGGDWSNYWEQVGGSAVCREDPYEWGDKVYSVGEQIIGTNGENYTCIRKTSGGDLGTYADGDINNTKPISGFAWNWFWSQTGTIARDNTRLFAVGRSYSATPSWRVEYSNNPAWVCVDVLTQPVIKDDNTIDRYEGVSVSVLDIPTFMEWADFCDVLVDDGTGLGTLERRIVFNGCFDTQKSVWESALLICGMARAMLVRSGTDYSVVIDQAGSVEAFFSSGNVERDSFRETFLSLTDRAGEVEVSFLDEDNEYEKRTVAYYDPNMTDNDANKITIDGIGITRASQAWRLAKYMTLCNRYQRRTIEFEVSWDAMRVRIGTIIKFSHDVPRWGLCDGNIVSATANTVTLDQSVTLESGKSYSILIRVQDDTLATKAITSPAGTYTTLSISGTFTTIPDADSPYALGETDVEAKPFRIIAIEGTQDITFKITAIEYDENIYTVDTEDSVKPVIDYSYLESVEVVTNLGLLEVSRIDDSGNLRRSIKGSFTKPVNSFLYAGADVFYRVSGETSWIKLASMITETYFELDDVLPSTTYYFAIVSVAFDGTRTTIGQFTPVGITTTDVTNHTLTALGSRITGLCISGQGNGTVFYDRDCKFDWNDVVVVTDTETGAGEEPSGAGDYVPPSWFKCYEVEILNIDGIRLRIEYTKNSRYTYTYENNCEDGNGIPVGSFTIKVKAMDGFGNVSEKAAVLTVSNGVPANIRNQMAVSTVDGVKFTWGKNTEDTDFYCYYLRTKVGETGPWSEYIDYEDNSYTRRLTALEVTSSTNKAMIYIEVQCKDVFGNLSPIVATCSAKAGQIADNIFQLVSSTDGATGSLSSLYDGVYSSGGVNIA